MTVKANLIGHFFDVIFKRGEMNGRAVVELRIPLEMWEPIYRHFDDETRQIYDDYNGSRRRDDDEIGFLWTASVFIDNGINCPQIISQKSMLSDEDRETFELEDFRVMWSIVEKMLDRG